MRLPGPARHHRFEPVRDLRGRSRLNASYSGFVNDASLRSVATSTQREPSTAKMAGLPDVSEPFRGISSLSGAVLPCGCKTARYSAIFATRTP